MIANSYICISESLPEINILVEVVIWIRNDFEVLEIFLYWKLFTIKARAIEIMNLIIIYQYQYKKTNILIKIYVFCIHTLII